MGRAQGCRTLQRPVTPIFTWVFEGGTRVELGMEGKQKRKKINAEAETEG